MEKIAIVFWSQTGNTEAMAEGIAKGAKDAGAEVELFNTSAKVDKDAVLQYNKIAFGCPSMGEEVLEEDEFEPFFTAVEAALANKKVALFGSYGWGDGEWMRDWVERTKKTGASLYDDGFIVEEAPEAAPCEQYGRDFAGF